MQVWDSLEQELQKIYDSEIHVDIGWLWGGGIDVSIGNGEFSVNVGIVAEVLPCLQEAIADTEAQSEPIHPRFRQWCPVRAIL